MCAYRRDYYILISFFHLFCKQKIDLKKNQTSSSSKNRLQRKDTPATTITAATNLSNKNLGHASRHFSELENSSEEGGYIQAISPTPPLLQQQQQETSSHQHHLEAEEGERTSPFSRAAAALFSPPPSCAVDIERENKQPKIRLKESWDGLVMLHSPKEEEGSENENGTNHAVTTAASPRLLNHHHYHSHQNHHSNHASRSRSPGPTRQESQQTRPLAAVSTTTAAAGFQGNNEVGAQLEGPLATPQALLEEISRLVAINDQEHVISALVLLTKGVKHHQHRLNECLAELLAVITACLQSSDDKVVLNALNTAKELVRVNGDSLLQHMYAQQQQQQQHQDVFLLQLLLCASRPSASSIKTNSDALLKRIASTMHQSSIIKLLEPFTTRSGSGGSGNSSIGDGDKNNKNISSVAIRNKAASTLLIASYRVS
jgi:hypothetical protein